MEPAGAGEGPSRMSLSSRKSLFTEGDSWLHWVYIAAVALAAVAVFILSRPRLLAIVGAAGLAAVVAFLVGFNSMLGRESKEAGKMSVKLEVGAYLTLAAFAGLAVHGMRTAGRTDTG